MPAILERATGSITTSVDDVNAVNEVQTIELNDIGTADTFTLTYGGQTTSTITFNATPATFAADIQTKLLALSNIGPADVTVTATDGNSMVVTFVGDLRGRQGAQISIKDVAARTILAKTGLDFNVSGVKYDELLGSDGVDQAGNVTADVARGVF